MSNCCPLSIVHCRIRYQTLQSPNLSAASFISSSFSSSSSVSRLYLGCIWAVYSLYHGCIIAVSWLYLGCIFTVFFTVFYSFLTVSWLYLCCIMAVSWLYLDCIMPVSWLSIWQCSWLCNQGRPPTTLVVSYILGQQTQLFLLRVISRSLINGSTTLTPHFKAYVNHMDI